MEMAIIGLGKMGKGVALKAREGNVSVIGLTQGEFPKELREGGVEEASSLDDLIAKTKSPRVFFLYVPAGPAVESYVKEFHAKLSSGDVVVDAGNSYWGDSVRRHAYLKEKGIHLIDLGTSGGISGAREGACFMAGGDREAYEKIEPILKTLAGTEAYAYIGPSGSGHLVKLIHNGIEFGMLQAIGEGMALLEKFRESLPFDMGSVFKVYRHGSVIRSWLIDLMSEQYENKKGLRVPDYVEDTGEVNWLIEDALHLEVPVPVIGQSIMELFRSRDKERNDYRAIAMMRHGFGGHPFGEKDELKIERKTSRIDPSFQEIGHGH